MPDNADLWSDEEWRAAMSTKDINDLPDSDFAYIESGGEKDDDGKTTPRSLRHYPIHDAAHVRNALARAAAAIDGDDEDAKAIAEKAMPNILAAAKKFDIEVSDDETKSRVPAAAIRSEYRNVPETRISPRSEFELREVPNGTGGTNLRFTGFASVTNADYEMEDWLGPWTESVSVGAFGKTLSEGADVAFLLNHSGMTLARTKPGTLKLSEVSEGAKSPISGLTGLHTEAMLDPENMYVQAARSAVDRGDLDEMSFAFRVMRQEWNDDYDRRWINEVSLDKGDVSLVNYGANPTTGGTVALRQKLGIRNDAPSIDRLVALVKRSRLFGINYEVLEGKVLSSGNAAKLQEALDALHSTDDTDLPGIVTQLQAIDLALDTGQAAISAVLQVADPDGDPNDLEPDLTPPKTESALPDYGTDARARLESLRHRRGAA